MVEKIMKDERETILNGGVEDYFGKTRQFIKLRAMQ